MKIEVIKGDITKIKVDAIVNAAHEMLMGGGGVDGAIHRAAGEGLLLECRDIEIKDGIRCKVGEAHLTRGYNLPAPYVVHTVAPKFVGSVVYREGEKIYKNIDEDGDSKLESCYICSLFVAEKHGLKSIAFPSLGTGGHSYPIELACPIAINAVKKALPCTSIERVIFVCYSDHDYEVYKRGLTK